MRVDPVDIVIDRNFKFHKKIFLISGNEITLMNKMCDLFKNKVKESGDYSIEKIKNIASINQDGGLFNNYKFYIINDLLGLDNKFIDKTKDKKDIYVFISENSPKTNKIKGLFIKRDECVLLDCYELSKESKSRLVKEYFNQNSIKVSGDIFWELLESLDNKYMLLENELDKIASIENNSNVNNDDLKKLISKNESSIEKIFFLILKDNFQLVDSYNRNITTITELNRLYFTVKQYCLYIIGSDNEKDFEKNIPKYLFREKSLFLNIFNKFDYKKKLKLLDLLFKTEKLIRINGDQSVSLGLRFLLNLKKITIS